MSTNPNPRWYPYTGRLLALAALILCILAALSFAGVMSANVHFLLACALGCIAAEGVL